MPEFVQETEHRLRYRHLIFPGVDVSEQIRSGVIDLIVYVLTCFAEGAQMARNDSMFAVEYHAVQFRHPIRNHRDPLLFHEGVQAQRTLAHGRLIGLVDAH